MFVGRQKDASDDVEFCQSGESGSHRTSTNVDNADTDARRRFTRWSPRNTNVNRSEADTDGKNTASISRTNRSIPVIVCHGQRKTEPSDQMDVNLNTQDKDYRTTSSMFQTTYSIPVVVNKASLPDQTEVKYKTESVKLMLYFMTVT